MNGAEMFVGKFEVITTHGRGHPPEFYANRMIERLMYVSEHAPPPIRDQALASKERMYAVVLHGIKDAIASDRTTIVGALRKAGLDEAAAFVTNMEK